MDRRCRLAGSLSGRVAVAAAAAMLAGCTMCPDPYDYSGPVPNGSTPQNDFRARSNGILPIGAAPCPWPQLVKSKHVGSKATIAAAKSGTNGQRGEPTLADPAVETAAAAEELCESTDPKSVLIVVADADSGGDGDPAADPAASAMLVLGEEPAEAALDQSKLDQDVSSDTESNVESAGSEPPPAVPSLAETPGWRTRR